MGKTKKERLQESREKAEIWSKRYFRDLSSSPSKKETTSSNQKQVADKEPYGLTGTLDKSLEKEHLEKFARRISELTAEIVQVTLEYQQHMPPGTKQHQNNNKSKINDNDGKEEESIPFFIMLGIYFFILCYMKGFA